MSKSINTILANHKEANRRREAGLPVWDRTINIKAILNRDIDNTSEEHAASVANEIAALLRSKVPRVWIDVLKEECDWDLLELVEGMEALRPDSYADDATYSALEDLNNMLDQLYDWADDRRVWLGI